MFKDFSLTSSYRWIDKLQTYIEFYNNRKHRTLKFLKPNQVNKENEASILKSCFSFPKRIEKKHKFSLGDFVRITRVKVNFL